MTRTKITIAIMLAVLWAGLSAAVASGQATSGLPAPSVSTIYPNAASTGTTLNTLTKLTGAPSTVVITATTDTSGVVGVTVGNAGTSGVALVQTSGLVNLAFDGATTAGDYVQISTTTAGDGHDTGSATCPTSGQVVGRVLSTNGSAGTYQINLGANGCGSGGGSGVTWPSSTDIVISTGTNTPNGLAPVNGDCVVGSGGAWTAGACSSGGYTNLNGTSNQTTASQLNTLCASGSIYATTPLSIATGGTITCPVQFSKAGVWTIASGQTVTFTGAVTETDQPSQIFAGSGMVAFSSSNYGSPSVQAHAPVEWWGAKGDGSTDNSTAIQACFTAGPIQCQLQVGTYNFVGPLTISASAVGIAGANGTGSANTSILQNTSASTDSIRVWGTGTGSQLVGNRFNDFLVWRSVTPTGTPAGLSFKFTASNVVERVNSNDSYQLFYLNNFANGLIEDSHGYWNHGTSTLASYYCYYVDGANMPQSTTLINDTCVDPNVSNTVTAFEATGADISDIFLTLFQASGTEYGEVWDGSTGGSGGFHATDDHSTDAILDHISTSAYKVVDYSAVNSNLLEIKGGWCNAPGTNTTPLIDVESSSGVVFSNVQCTSTTVAATIPETVYVNGSSNIGFVNNILTQATGATSSSVMLLNNSNTISITGNQIYTGSSRITAGIAGTSLTASTIAGNAINGNSGATTGITFDASSTGNSALTNAFGTLLHTVVDSAGTNQWCDGTVPCHNVASGGGTTTNALTMNNGGSGAASGTTFNGSAAQTISYNTIGAAPLASPTFTGTPAAPTATGGTSTTQLATTAFVQAAIATAGTGGGIVTYSGPSLTFSGTLYFPIGGGGLSSTTESNVDIDSPAATTVQNMTIQMSAAPGVGNSITYTWRKNGSSTALTCTISGSSATSCSDTTHSFTTVALDLLDIQAVTTGTVVGTPTVVMAAQMGVAASGGTGAMTNITNSITWSGCTVSSGVCATTGSVSTISASSIPGTYNHLIFEMSGIGSTAIALTCQLNSDTSAHYANQGPTTNAGSISSTNTVSQTAFGCGDAGTLASHSRIEMPFYSGANPKSIIVNTSLWSSVSSSTNNFTNLINSLWTGTAAITAVSFTTSSGTISSGYQIAVYGVN